LGQLVYAFGFLEKMHILTLLQLQSIHKALHAQPVTSLPAFFIIRPSVTLNSYEVAPVEEYESFFAGISPDQVRHLASIRLDC
jgi:hypothetical protein